MININDWPNNKYDIIYIDPPWPMDKINRRTRPNQGSMDYPLMSMDDIKNLKVDSIANDNCMLFLWATHRFLPDSFELIKHWKFKYINTVTWDKKNGLCLFGFHRRTEFLLVAYRGKVETFPKMKAFPTIITEKSVRHSRKPDMARSHIERFGNKRIELFARERHEGWDVWGNEV